MKTKSKKINSFYGEALKSRDKEDKEIESKNKKFAGMKPHKPGKIISIDSGKIFGANNVAKLIIKDLSPDVRVISIEGLSGTGKSSTAEHLRRELKGMKFSMGEVFRYFTYLRLKNDEEDFGKVASNLRYEINRGKLSLFDGETNVTQNLAKDLRGRNVEEAVPAVSKISQKEAINFMAREIGRIKTETKRKIILEGRSFTINFLPSDLRVKLFADEAVKAKRRKKQYRS